MKIQPGDIGADASIVPLPRSPQARFAVSPGLPGTYRAASKSGRYQPENTEHLTIAHKAQLLETRHCGSASRLAGAIAGHLGLRLTRGDDYHCETPTHGIGMGWASWKNFSLRIRGRWDRTG